MSNHRIFKYELDITDRQILKLPAGSRILHADNQNGQLCLWAIVDAAKECATPVEIKIVGTGQPINDLDRERDVYFKTVMSGYFVWHIFISYFFDVKKELGVDD